MKPSILISLISLWMGFVLTARETPLVKNFLPELIQSANQNWSVAQAGNRFIYAGNTAGMLQYDGSRWQLWHLPNRQIVRTVATDQHGNIFCGGFATFGYWRPDNNGVLTYHALNEAINNDKIDKEEIWHIVVWQGKVYFQSFSALYCYDYQRVREIPIPGNIMFMQPIRDQLIFPVIDKGLYRLQPNGSFEFIPGTAPLRQQIVAGMAALGKDSILIGTERQGLFVWSAGKLVAWDVPIQRRLQKTRLNKITPLNDGHLAFGTVGDGLMITNQHGDIIYHIHRGKGLQNNTVLAMQEDMDGNLWVGMDKGLDLMLLDAPLRFSLDRSGNLGTVYAACTFNQAIYLGTNQGLFFRRTSDKADTDAWQAVQGIKGQVWELSVVDGQLLCGHNEGSFLIEDGWARKISAVTGGWITRACPWNTTYLLQGTYTGLVALKRGRGITFSHRIQGFEEAVEYMAFDAAGQLWVANPYQGVYRLTIDKALQQVTAVQRMRSEDGIANDFDPVIQEIRGAIILQAGGLFYRLDQVRGRWEQLTGSQDFPLSGNELKLLPALGNAHFAVYADKVRYFMGARQEGFNLRMVHDRPGIFPFDDTTWLLCLDDGYALYDYSRKGKINKPPAMPTITSIEIMGHRRERKLSSLRQDAQRQHTLEADEQKIIFYFSALRFDQRAAYRWRLSGLNDLWSAWQDQPFQEFSFLPPGQYRFELQSDQSSQTAQFEFIIRPPWYQTWQFRLITGLLMAAILILLQVRHRRVLQARHRRALLERERQLQQQLIRERNEQLQEDVLKKAKDLANSTMQLIRKNEVLLEIRQRVSALGRDNHQVQQLKHLLEQELSSENDWAVFEENFNSVHEAFLKKMKTSYPELTPGDLRLAAYLKMNLSSKEIAPLMGISIRGLENKRYRLRKKMQLDSDDNLVAFLLEF